MNEKIYNEYLITIYKEISFAEAFNQKEKTYEEISNNIKQKFEVMSSLFNNGLAKEYLKTMGIRNLLFILH